MDRTLFRNFIIFSFVSVLAFATLLTALVYKSAKVSDMREAITHTYNVLEVAARIGMLSESMINAQRAYIISGKAGFMDEYNENKTRMSAALASFADLTADNKSQQDRLVSLRNFYTGLSFNLEERARKYVRSDRAGFAEGAGIVDMLRRNILRINNDMMAEEKGLLSMRMAKADEFRHQYSLTLYVGSVACVILMLTLNLFLLLSQKKKIKIEQSLRESEDRFEKAAEGANDGIFDWHLAGERIYCARPFFAMLGIDRPADTVSVEAFMALVNPEDRETLKTAMHRYLGGELTAFAVEVRMRQSSGRWIWVLARAKASYGDDGKPVRLIGAVTDITSMKATQERLEMARLDAEKASRSKSDFLAHMSHEIRTPLTAVCGVAEILEKSRASLPEKQGKLVETLNVSALALKDLVNDVLDYSKIEQGEMNLELTRFDVAGLLEQVRVIMTTTALEKNLDLVFDVSAIEGGAAMGDANRIRQILLNVVGNAIKFTQSGYVKLAARFIDDQALMARFLEIEVSDTGIGIDESALESIFERFKQGDSSISRKFGGTGLGLPIARDLARLMGGDVTVSSRKGVGSQFRITIAAGEVAGATQDVPPVEAAAGAVPVAQVRADATGRVLVADDIESNILIVGSILDDLGVPYDVAGNGRSALEAALAKSYGLIFMDVQMPEMDGVTATRLIREGERKAGHTPSPIVGMTAHAFAEDRRRCLDAGMDGYLTKPIETAEYVKVIGKYLDITKAAGHLGAPAA